MAILRSFCLLMSESPKWLEEAGASINTISRINKSAYIMSNSQLRQEQTESHRSMWMTFSMIAGLFTRGKTSSFYDLPEPDMATCRHRVFLSAF
jgi:hypothetical protein